MAVNRREAIKKVALAMGGAVSAPSMLGLMQGCTFRPDPNWTPTFFTEDQAVFVMEIAETIMPRTDTPGAKDLGIPSFIEKMVSQFYDKKMRETFMAEMKAFRDACQKSTGKDLVDMDNLERYNYLNAENDRITELEFKPDEKARPFFWRMKELTLLAYFTSEVGATQVLQYQAIPVEYHGCITLDEAGGKTWAT
ncbi:MAG: gluconate 2-dehydrogenase subunit 3 family protein [Cyclobacteriaceae bacterium]|nr:gluconate 2-dehydrogenase subunit 3 family protein [Cyclobacteriaceae bacterium HetDA_MAG_MS6]